jgi:hypothetical protein
MRARALTKKLRHQPCACHGARVRRSSQRRAVHPQRNGFSQIDVYAGVVLSPLAHEISVNRTRAHVDLIVDVVALVIARASRRLERLQATQQGHSNGCEEEG